MSRKFQEKNKELIGLTVVDSTKIWKKKNGKYVMKDNINLYGKVDKGFSSAITTCNKKGQNHKFVDDFSDLPKNCKNKITDMFLNNKKKVAYLVKEKK